MSILLYCVATKSGLPQPATGVAGLAVLCFEHDNVVVLFSRGASVEAWTGAPLRESARRFHQVLQRVFEAGPIIPFRLPTLMENDEELMAHLRENAISYSTLLRKFQNSAQMEAVISYSDVSQPATKPSGAEYLRTRQKRAEELQRAATQLQECAGSIAKQWRVRSVQNTARAFALLDRSAIDAFKEKLRGFPVPAGFTVRVNGPWPVTEFMDVNKG